MIMTKNKIDIGNSKMREICLQKSNGHTKGKPAPTFLGQKSTASLHFPGLVLPT